MNTRDCISDHFKWCARYEVKKYHSKDDKDPYETLTDGKNVVLDDGANAMLRLICGEDIWPFDNENAMICVSNSATPESPSQTGVLGTEYFHAPMDSGYPVVDGRQVTFRSTFEASEANFRWREVCITNGDNENSVSLNRKVVDFRTKDGEIWIMQIVISMLS